MSGLHTWGKWDHLQNKIVFINTSSPECFAKGLGMDRVYVQKQRHLSLCRPKEHINYCLTNMTSLSFSQYPPSFFLLKRPLNSSVSPTSYHRLTLGDLAPCRHRCVAHFRMIFFLLRGTRSMMNTTIHTSPRFALRMTCLPFMSHRSILHQTCMLQC